MCVGSGAWSWEDMCLDPWVVTAEFSGMECQKIICVGVHFLTVKSVIALVSGTTAMTVLQVSPGTPPGPSK